MTGRRVNPALLDTDTLIAATALARGLILVTSNERHLRRIPDLRAENWRRP